MKSLSVLLALHVLASPCLAESPLTVVSPESQGFSSERLSRLDKAMQGYVDRREVSGCVCIVARHGKVVYHKSFGYRDVEARARMSNDVIFGIMSMTKPIVSVALMQLWEHGKFQLDDPVSKYLPEFAEMRVASPGEDGQIQPTPAKKPIRVKHVLTHTSGLASWYRGIGKAAYAKASAKRRPDWTLGEFVSELAKQPLNYEPGAYWEYGAATDVVGRLVEVLSGESLDEYLRKHVYEPLGMPDTYFYLPEEKLPRLAAAYRRGADGKIALLAAPDENSRFFRGPRTFFSGQGGLVSTTHDYFRFHQMMLGGGEIDGVRILGPMTVRLMTSNHIGDEAISIPGHGHGFGLGYSVVTAVGQSGLPNSIGTFSWGGAWGTVFFVDPEQDMLGVMMTQISPYSHLNIRRDFQTLTYSALLE